MSAKKSLRFLVLEGFICLESIFVCTFIVYLLREDLAPASKEVRWCLKLKPSNYGWLLNIQIYCYHYIEKRFTQS